MDVKTKWQKKTQVDVPSLFQNMQARCSSESRPALPAFAFLAQADDFEVFCSMAWKLGNFTAWCGRAEKMQLYIKHTSFMQVPVHWVFTNLLRKTFSISSSISVMFLNAFQEFASRIEKALVNDSNCYQYLAVSDSNETSWTGFMD